MKTKLSTLVWAAAVAVTMSACQGQETLAEAQGRQALASSTNLAFYPLATPVRLLDTRPGHTAVYAPGAPLRSESLTRYGISGVPQVPANARVLVANVSLSNYRTQWTVWRDTWSYWDTATDYQLYPHLQVFPSATLSSASSAYQRVGAGPSHATAQLVSIPLDDTGAFSLRPARIDVTVLEDRDERWVSDYTFDATVDIVGYYAAPGAFGALYLHLFDTPQGFAEPWCNNNCWPAPPVALGGPLADGETRQVTAWGTFNRADSAGQFTIPTSARILVGQIKAIAAYQYPGQTSLTNIYAAGAARPDTGLVIQDSGWDAASFLVPLSNTGAFNLTTDKSAYVSVDVVGYFSEQPGSDVNGAGLVYTPQASARLSSQAQLDETDFAHLSAVQTGMPAAATAVAGHIDYASGGEGSCLSVYPVGIYSSTYAAGLCVMLDTNNTGQGTLVSRLSADHAVDVGPGAPDVTSAAVELDVAGYFTPAL